MKIILKVSSSEDSSVILILLSWILFCFPVHPKCVLGIKSSTSKITGKSPVHVAFVFRKDESRCPLTQLPSRRQFALT